MRDKGYFATAPESAATTASPENGKVKFMARPKNAAVTPFFMRVKVTP